MQEEDSMEEIRECKHEVTFPTQEGEECPKCGKSWKFGEFNNPEELKNCPFCSSEAILEISDSDDCYVICKACLNCTNHYDHHSKATQAWNTRSNPKQELKCLDVEEVYRTLDHACPEVMTPRGEEITREQAKAICDTFGSDGRKKFSRSNLINFLDTAELESSRREAFSLKHAISGETGSLADSIIEHFKIPSRQVPSLEEIYKTIRQIPKKDSKGNWVNIDLTDSDLMVISQSIQQLLKDGA